MARKLRVQYPGALYHVMNRGDRREASFTEDSDRELFLALGWTARDLQGRRKSDPQKVRMALRLRRETTMTLEWIAKQLCMGTPTHVACLVQRYSQEPQNNEVTPFRMSYRKW